MIQVVCGFYHIFTILIVGALSFCVGYLFSASNKKITVDFPAIKEAIRIKKEKIRAIRPKTREEIETEKDNTIADNLYNEVKDRI